MEVTSLAKCLDLSTQVKRSYDKAPLFCIKIVARFGVGGGSEIKYHGIMAETANEQGQA